jgi:hypothetical protein
VLCPWLVDVPDFMNLAMTPGPHAYEVFADIVKDWFQFEVLLDAEEIRVSSILHTKGARPDDPDHCCPLLVDGTVHEPDDEGQPLSGTIGVHDLRGRMILRLLKVWRESYIKSHTGRVIRVVGSGGPMGKT